MKKTKLYKDSAESKLKQNQKQNFRIQRVDWKRSLRRKLKTLETRTVTYHKLQMHACRRELVSFRYVAGDNIERGDGCTEVWCTVVWTPKLRIPGRSSAGRRPERESSVHPYCAAGKEGEGGFDNRGCAKDIIVISWYSSGNLVILKPVGILFS